jgi:hypothetical protein
VNDTKTFAGLTAVMRALEAPDAVGRQRPARWSRVALTSLAAVEALLDWLEASGYEQREVEVVGATFVVRWR